MFDLVFVAFSQIQSGDSSLIRQRRIVAQNNLSISTATTARDAYEAALTFHQLEDFGQAIPAYQRAIAVDPSFVSPYINLGLIYIGIGQFAEAEALLQTVLTLRDHPEEPASTHAIAHYNLGIIYSRQGDTTKALMMVNRALAIAPDFQQARNFQQQLQELPEQP